MSVEVATVGDTANAVVVDEDVAWIVQSARNTVGRLDLDTGAYDIDFLDVGNDHNPWALASADGRIYVTNYVTETVTVADRDTGVVLAELGGSLETPAGLAVGAGFLVVANTGFVGDWDPASVSVFRLLPSPPYAEEIAKLSTTALNTIEVVFDAAHARFLVVSAGSRDGELVTSDGAVDIIDADLMASDPASALIASIPLPIVAGDPYSGGPGDLAIGPNGSAAYIASAASPAVFKLDLETLELLRGPNDPIIAYDGTGAQLTRIAPGPGDTMLISAFNMDSLFVLDTRCDFTVAGPVGLGNATDLEGPVDIAYDEVRGQALVLMTLSNSLTVVTDL